MAAQKKSACQQKAAHRAAQNKHVAKNPKAQAARVAKGNGKNAKTGGGSSGGKSGSKSKGAGQHGNTIGRPRKGSC